MQKIKDAVVKTGEYEKDGQTKGRYMNVGAMFKRDDGSVCMKLDALPLVQGDVWINFYDPKGREQQQEQRQHEPEREIDEIPFN